MPFEKGQSGNPGGRPKEVDEVKRLARQHGPAAVTKLAELMNCGNPRTEVAAAQALLDRGFGKPAQAITGEDGGPLEITVMSDAQVEARLASFIPYIGLVKAEEK